MITGTIDKNKGRIIISCTDELELEQMHMSFTKYIRNARFRARGKWDGSVHYFRNNSIPIGFWKELQRVCEKYNLSLKLVGDSLYRDDITRAEVIKFCNAIMANHPKITPYPYQIKAVYIMAKYGYCICDLSTSSGKTLMSYLYFQYCRWKGLHKRFLMVTPDTDLVVQAYSDYDDYETGMNPKYKLDKCMVHGGNSLKDISNHVLAIGNFQTLSNRDTGFFDGITSLLIDETHRAKAKSIKDIIKMSSHATSVVGISGTLKNDNSADYYDLEANIGPKLMTLTKHQIISQGKATPVKIIIIILDYLEIEKRRILAEAKEEGTNGSDAYEMECELLRNSKSRLEFVSAYVANLKGNTIVFFNNIEYGKRLTMAIKQRSNKSVYYVDGTVTKKTRVMINQRMEIGEDKVLVASWPTYATGKSIKAIKHGVAAEPRKSDELVGQALGRGMRLHEDKDVFMFHSIVDDYSYDDLTSDISYSGVLNNQMKSRIKLYNELKFAYTKKRVKLSNNWL